MLLVGSNVGIGKSIVAFLPVPLFALLRFVIALAVLWPLFRIAKMRRVKRGEWINLFLQALFGTFGFTLLMLGGVHRTSAVAAGVITSTIPAIVALFSWLFLRERPDARAFASIGLAIAGIAVMAIGGNTSSRWSNLLMRYRILAQAVALAVIALVVYVAGGR